MKSDLNPNHSRIRKYAGPTVRHQLRNQSTPGSNPDSTEIRRVLGLLHAKSYVWDQTSFRWCAEGRLLRCRPRHLTEAQNYEVRPKLAFELLQNGTLI
ncbi:hypothetical protein AVEN_61525-1 [Araneus ventricosus]|uniref:Uncharacterized protein n=1 Tax=Araneus ventricosus TaxID=182803 RepID=A0A4Y2I9G3_ARAVE|nr:hypothetical protein AVEN_61525-1 [Araneus ventricosus]